MTSEQVIERNSKAPTTKGEAFEPSLESVPRVIEELKEIKTQVTDEQGQFLDCAITLLSLLLVRNDERALSTNIKKCADCGKQLSLASPQFLLWKKGQGPKVICKGCERIRAAEQTVEEYVRYLKERDLLKEAKPLG